MANIIEISNYVSPELDIFSRLTEAQLRNRQDAEKGLFIAESPKVIERALNAGYDTGSVPRSSHRIFPPDSLPA